MTDLVSPAFVRPGRAAPRGWQGVNGHPSVRVRLDPCVDGQLTHLADRHAVTRPEVMRRAIDLLLVGCEHITPEQNEWLLRLARANDAPADPYTALGLLLDQLRVRYPAAGRLAPP